MLTLSLTNQIALSAGKRGRLSRDCYIFASDWLGEWGEFSGPITELGKAKLFCIRARYTTVE